MANKRCLKCGTAMAESREICPICGWDFTSTSEGPSRLQFSSQAPKAAVSRSARSKKTICPECFQSFDPEAMVEVEGKSVCENCATLLEKRLAKEQASQDESAGE